SPCQTAPTSRGYPGTALDPRAGDFLPDRTRSRRGAGFRRNTPRPIFVGTAGFPVAVERRDRGLHGPAGGAASGEWYCVRAARSPVRVLRERDASAPRRRTPLYPGADAPLAELASLWDG